MFISAYDFGGRYIILFSTYEVSKGLNVISSSNNKLSDFTNHKHKLFSGENV